MPAFQIPIGGIIRAVTYCIIPGQASTNTHKWQLTSLSSGSNFDSSAFLTFYDLAMQSVYLPLLSNDAQYYGTQMYLMNPIGPAPRPDSTNGNQAAGTAGAGLLPAQTSGLISFYTLTLGKTGQGRSYIPFPCPGDNGADGTPAAGYVTALADLAIFLKSQQTVINGGQTATFRPCLYRGGVDVPRFIETANNPDAWATQRRRGAYGRLNKAPF